MLRSLTILLLLPAAALADDFATHAQPLLKKYCYECHGSKTQEGGIQVTQLKTSTDAFEYLRFPENIAHALDSGSMPPKDEVLEGELTRGTPFPPQARPGFPRSWDRR